MNNAAVRCAFGLFLAASPVSLAAQEQTGAIHGRVVDLDDGTGVAGAAVSLQGDMTSSERNVAASAGGWFSFENLPPGEYTIRANSDGYSPSAPMSVILGAGDNKEITIQAGRSPTEGSASGTVRDADDKPIKLAYVCLERKIFNDFGDASLSSELGGSQREACASTGPDGRFETDKVDPGVYFLEAFVGVRSAPGTFYPGVDDSRNATPIAIGSRPVTGLDIRVEPRPAWTIRAEIAPSGVLEEEATVTVVAYRNGAAAFRGIAHSVPGSSRRVVTIPNVPDGAYILEAEARREGAILYPAVPSPPMAGFADVDVRGADVDNVQIPIDPDVNVRVIVLRPGQEMDPSLLSPDPSAGPQRRVRVSSPAGSTEYIVQPDGTWTPIPGVSDLPKVSLACRGGSSETFRSATAISDRILTIGSVPRAKCLLEVENLSAENYVESAKVEGEDIWDRIFVPAPASPNLIVTLAGDGGVVGGHILDEQGNVFAGSATVVLEPSPPTDDHPSVETQIRTTASGEFEIHNIRPGKYRLFAFTGTWDESLANDSPLLQEFESRAADLVMEKNGRPTSDLTVIRLP